MVREGAVDLSPVGASRRANLGRAHVVVGAFEGAKHAAMLFVADVSGRC